MTPRTLTALTELTALTALTALTTAFGLLVSTSAEAAKEPPSAPRANSLRIAASVGYALPVGSSETGARLSDTTHGTVPLEALVSYAFTHRLAVGLSASYGVGIPTLCATGADCVHSLGSDVIVGARSQVLLTETRRLSTELGLGIGYEWYSSTLSDAGVVSTHSYRGPILFALSLAAPIRASSRFRIGPVLGGAVGTFTDYVLDTSAWTNRGPVQGRTLHGWVSLSVRGSVEF